MRRSSGLRGRINIRYVLSDMAFGLSRLCVLMAILVHDKAFQSYQMITAAGSKLENLRIFKERNSDIMEIQLHIELP